MLSLGAANGREVESLQNWLDGNGCLAREGAAYLAHHRDLVSLAPAGDNAMLQFESWVEDKLIRFSRAFRKVRRRQAIFAITNDIIEPSSRCLVRSECVYLLWPLD